MKKIIAGAFSVALLSTPAVAQSPVLESIASDGVVTIGHREASTPFSFIDDNGNVSGYSIDLCLEIVEDIKKQLGRDDLQVNYVPVNPQTRIALVANGTVDLECGATTNNLTRQQQVGFSPIMYTTGTRLLVTKDSGISGIGDMDGMRIAVAQGAANEVAVTNAADALGIEIDLLYTKDIAEAMLALETDRVDAVTSDDILLYGLASKSSNPDKFSVVGDFLSYEPYAIMINRADPDFALLVNRTLSRLFRTQEINAIYEKWFEPMGVPMTDSFIVVRDLQALNE